MKALLMGALALVPLCAHAEVKSATPESMLIEHRFAIAAPAMRVWETLLHPERWWPADHTWSGKRENLGLDASIGGCFCERWDGNGVEHGRVVMLMPGKLCGGLQIHVDDPGYNHSKFRPWRLVALAFKALRAIRSDYPLWRDFPYEYETTRLAIDLINGGPALREWVDDPAATPGDLDELARKDENEWQSKE